MNTIQNLTCDSYANEILPMLAICCKGSVFLFQYYRWCCCTSKMACSSATVRLSNLSPTESCPVTAQGFIPTRVLFKAGQPDA